MDRPCDICGKPATQAARDVLRKENWASGWYDHRPGGEVRYGCDDHPPESHTIDVEDFDAHQA